MICLLKFKLATTVRLHWRGWAHCSEVTQGYLYSPWAMFVRTRPITHGRYCVDLEPIRSCLLRINTLDAHQLTLNRLQHANSSRVISRVSRLNCSWGDAQSQLKLVSPHLVFFSEYEKWETQCIHNRIHLKPEGVVGYLFPWHRKLVVGRKFFSQRSGIEL